MNSDSLILRETDNAPLINKEDTLTSVEFDANIIKIYDDFVAINSVADSTLTFDVDRSYLVGEYCTYGGRLWISTEISTGVTPVIGGLDWIDAFPTILAHQKNKDTILDEGGANETTVSEIRAFIDAGLTSTTNLTLTTKTATSFKIESSTGSDVTIPQATNVDAGLLNAEDKVKLDNTSGINTGDQTLASLSGEDVTNKVTDFTTINDTLYPTTQAVDTYITAVVPDLVETFLDSNVELNTNKATDFTTINDTLYPSVKAVDDQLDLKVTSNTTITGATKTKITYDSKGLVTSGVDATTADIADSTNKRYVTDANLTTIGNTSGTNTGDQVISDATISLTDITTNNFSTTKHGFVPKGTNVGNFLKDDGTWSTISAGGLTYFTEAQSTASPNATVNVDSLTAIASTTNADISIAPKGTGAFTLAIPNSLASGGNKRGDYAVDLQTFRTVNTRVASGGYSFIGGGANNTASGSYSSAFGAQTTASGNDGSFSAGYFCTASGGASFAIGAGNGATSYGAVAMGNNCYATGQFAFAMGQGSIASGNYSFSMGQSSQATGENSVAFGWYAHTFGISCRSVIGRGIGIVGDNQKSTFILGKRTTDATPSILSVDATTPSSTNQLVLQNNNSIRFKGSIIARQSGSTNTSAWDIDGIIQRGVGAGTTTLLISNVNVVQNTPSWGTPTLTANTTLGCLTVTVIGAITTNIQWTCVIDTTEVIYA